MDKYSKISFCNIASQSKFIIGEFRKRNITILSNSRYGKYIICLEELGKCKCKDDYDKTLRSYGMPFILQSTNETMEIIGILKSFEKDNDANYAIALKKIKRGIEIPFDKEKDSEPRDILFELNIAAHFKAANLSCSLQEPDIILEFEGSKFHIACKRPQNEKKLKSHIKKARRQISSRGLGIIALSLDKMINPELKILQGLIIDREIEKFRAKHESKIRGWINETRKIIGILYSLSLTADDKSENIFVSCQKIYLIPFCNDRSPYFQKIKTISRILNDFGYLRTDLEQ